MKVQFLSVADQELADAFDWYENELPGLGYEFIAEVDRTVRRVGHYPEACADQGDGVRRALVYRFPYGLWDAVEQDTGVVYAIAHLHRQPRYWANRLAQKKQ
ncbi:MAG: hypothetical protein A3K19_00400 [Lentisphaerae bacterium RIFOXYB12_FULL_65_16]|nr:MAG: hypothetical protein A3K18_13970 [Lentisphaerae bacterium RIFOXYA12_64_32]OGV85333.1 MAG: hypothetical protein A3K19_00400 [Lentisphaerae bacterium RIFOXYB12_FULL_65_16]